MICTLVKKIYSARNFTRVVIFFFLSLCVLFEARAEKKLIKEYQDYRFYLSGAERGKVLTVQNKKGENVYEVTGHDFNFVNYSKNLDLLGNGRKIVVFYGDTSENYCCRSYYIMEVSPSFNLIQKIDSLSSTIEFVKDKKSYSLAMGDSALYHFYSDFSDSYSPRVILSFNGKEFVFDYSKMTQKITRKDFVDIRRKTEREIKEADNINKRILPLIKYSLDLIYSGNSKYAFELINDVFKKFTFQIGSFHAGLWSQNKRHKNKNIVPVDSIKFKYDMFNFLACSAFKKNIIAINKNHLNIEECTANNLKSDIE